MEGPDTPALDVTPPLDYSDELNISTESWRSEGQEAGARGAHRPSPFTLRSQCGHHDDCPLGEGILFRSRISPSPAKQRVRSRRRRRSDQSHLYTTTSSASTTVLDVSALDVSSLDASSQDLDHSHHQRAHIHGHNHVDPIHDARRVAGAGSDAPQPLQPGQMVHHRSRTPSTKETGKAAEQITQSSVTHNQTELNTSSSEGEVGGGVGDLAKNVLAFFTPTKDKSLPAIIESSESGFEDGLLTGKSVAVSTPATEQFVGARDFFAQRTTRESLASDYLSYSDTPSRLRESTRRLSVRKPHNHYIAYSSDEELDDWKQQPKTDYTYSTSLTYRERVTPDRKIWSPNMSRRGLRGAGVGYAHSPDFSSSDLPSDSGQLNLRTRTILRPMDAFSDTSDGEEAGREEEMRSWSRRLRSSRSRSASVPKVNGATITTTVTTTSMTSKRMLSGGLDGESDVDDGTQTHLPRRATPLASRSGTPLPRGSTPAPSSLDTAKGGYTLAKGAIAEDVEEEQEEAGGVVSVWTRRTWRTITRITTIITTTIVMAAARTLASNKTAAVTANADNTMEKSSSTSSSAVFFVHRTRRRVAEAWTATQDRLKKDPILLWIPLLFLFLLLAVAEYHYKQQHQHLAHNNTSVT